MKDETHSGDAVIHIRDLRAVLELQVLRGGTDKREIEAKLSCASLH